MVSSIYYVPFFHEEEKTKRHQELQNVSLKLHGHNTNIIWEVFLGILQKGDSQRKERES